ncbi:MAG: RNA-binding domain-containing protein [Thermoplasmata archaeon]
MVRIHIRVPVYPTEDAEKVVVAVSNIFPDAVLTFEDENLLSGSARNLEKFATIIKNARIRDTVRAELYRNLKGNKTSFQLNKQAAYAGTVSFSIGEPLGEICVEIEDEDLVKLIDQIAPDTRELNNP